MPLLARLIVGIALGWLGYKILRDGQCPPAKEKVYRPTKILRGTKSRLIGYIHVSVFLPFLAFTFWRSFRAKEMSEKIQTKTSVCGEKASRRLSDI